MKSIGILTSGGLDSAALMGHYLDHGYMVHPIYIGCGLRWEKAEVYWVKKFLKTIGNKNVQPLKRAFLLLEDAYEKNWSQRGITPGTKSPNKSVFLPARNLLLVIKSLLVLHTKNVHELAIGTLLGNPFKDGTPAYFQNLERLMSQSFDMKIKLHVPFRHKKKNELIAKFSHYPLYLSFSCVNPHGHQHCGKCNKCAERKRAFKTAGQADLTLYQS